MRPTTDRDRLLYTLLFSVLLHIALVLGVSFDILSPPTNEPLNELEITLVRQQTPAPEEADFLAQADNEGGGEQEQLTPEPAPTLPVPHLEPSTSKPQLNTDPLPIPELPVPLSPTPATEPEPEPEPVPEPQPEPEVTPEPETATEPEPDSDKLTTDEASEEIVEDMATGEAASPAVPDTPARPSAESLMAQARNEISELQDELNQHGQSMSSTPEKRRISASTKEYAAAAYMQAWERKVERIGNLNYPNEARQKGINGTLMVSVDIRPDGSVPEDGIVISRSSGHEVLDEAAKKIVRMGAPYAPVPENVLLGREMLTVIRTWKFESDRGLSAR